MIGITSRVDPPKEFLVSLTINEPPTTTVAVPDPVSAPAPSRKAWPDYRAIWRWHFYASLLCIPFVVLLSITGAIYLFKTEIEAWTESPYDHLALTGAPQPASQQIQAVLSACPGATFQSYELPQTAKAAARVLVRKDGQSLRVYVHPETLAVLHSVPDQQRFMRQMFRLHGELMLGERGSNAVELAASWTIIMLITGLVLWWPRNTTGWAGVLYPRWRHGGRVFWRDFHSVTGIWISTFALFLLISGLPWSKFWGDYFRNVRQVTGMASARQDWSNASSSATRTGGFVEHADHGVNKRRGQNTAGTTEQLDVTSIDRVVAAVVPLQLPHPVVIGPPGRGSPHWTAKSMTPNRPWRENLTVNTVTGEIVSRDGFADRHFIDKCVAVGIAAHEGRLFGWPNQLLGLLTALGLLLMCFSGVVLWWRRREPGVLGTPHPAARPRFSWGLLALLILLGVCLPLFGASLLLVLAIEWSILSRIPPVQRWLGLRPRSQTAPAVATILLFALCIGCGGVRSVKGGTTGTLMIGDKTMSDMQITFYKKDVSPPEAVGFGVSTEAGRFELLLNGAKGPLYLPTGEYRCTVETAGAPIELPKEYLRPDQTPVIVNWTAGDPSITINLPAPKPSRR